MLILSRNMSEKIRIGDDIEVTILSINGKQAKIGIQAPSDISVHREEVYQRIYSEDKEKNHE